MPFKVIMKVFITKVRLNRLHTDGHILTIELVHRHFVTIFLFVRYSTAYGTFLVADRDHSFEFTLIIVRVPAYCTEVAYILGIHVT